MLYPLIGTDTSSFKGVLKWKIRAAFPKSGVKREKKVCFSRNISEDFHLLWNNFNLNGNIYTYDSSYMFCLAKICHEKFCIFTHHHIYCSISIHTQRVVGMTLESPDTGKKARIHSEHSENTAYFKCTISIEISRAPSDTFCKAGVTAVLRQWWLCCFLDREGHPCHPGRHFRLHNLAPRTLQLWQYSGFWSILSLWSALLWQMGTQFSICTQARLKVLAIWLSLPWGLELLQRHSAASISVSHF